MLVEIFENIHDVKLDLRYATENNFVGRRLYQNARCFIHSEALLRLEKAVSLARNIGYRIKIFDIYRPPEVTQIFWDLIGDENFVANPVKGSMHNRGVALDLTLVDHDGNELIMGTEFDDFSPLAAHGNTEISVEAQKNRAILVGIMSIAGFDRISSEWWHFQLKNGESYPIIADQFIGAYV